MTAVGCHVLNDIYFYNCIVAWLIFLKISFQFHSQKMSAILFWVFVAHGSLIKMEISYEQNCQFYCKPDISVLILAWLLLLHSYILIPFLAQIYYITIDLPFLIFQICMFYILIFNFISHLILSHETVLIYRLVTHNRGYISLWTSGNIPHTLCCLTSSLAYFKNLRISLVH